MREISSLLTFNRGLVSRLALGRVDLKRVSLSAEEMTNWMIRVMGCMSLRPGLGYLGATAGNAAARMLKFVFATTDTALLELTDSTMRVWIDDALLERPSVSTAVTNGTFAASLAGWTDNDEVGAASTWVSPNYMQLTGNGTARAIRDQTVTVAAGDRGIEHALRIVVARGPVTVRVGSTSGGDEYVRETVLNTGTHSLAFTPTGDFYVRLFTAQIPVVWVSQCTVEAAGVVTLPTPWAEEDLGNIRADQSGDVVWASCVGYQTRRIERRGTGRSWSVALYVTDDGPFRVQNTTTTSITASDITGNVTLTASKPLFRSTHVGALFSLTSEGQRVEVSATAEDTWSTPIRVTGVGTARAFSIVITNTFTATVTLQSSIDSDSGPWSDVSGKTWTAGAAESYNDALDNQIVWYRIGVKTGGYTSGTADCVLSIGSGSIRGIARITDYTSSTVVGAEVLTALGGTAATTTWQEGQWSDYRGWPTSLAFHEGRLWLAGKNGIWGSVSDAYDSFDETFEGDAGPINRTIGSGPVDTINWLTSLKRLILGGEGAELSASASSLDEILTPTNFKLSPSSNQGSGAVSACKVDQQSYFVQRNGCKVYEIAFDLQKYEYSANDLMAIVPELGQPGIVRMDCQRQPDTRLHCVRSDGKAVVAVMSKAEDVLGWLLVETDGHIEDVVTLPAESGDTDDRVYYVVRRTINGSTVRYLERWAQEGECRGGALNKQADSFVTYTGASTTTITGLDHLEGESVAVWADGADVGTNDSARPWTQRYTVSGGQIALAAAANNVVVGLPYTAPFKSAKLGTPAPGQSPLNAQKTISHVGLILADVHRKGLRFGPSEDALDDMPEVEGGVAVTQEVREAYDEQVIEFPGTWSSNSRIYLLAQAPRPCTVLAVTYDMEGRS